jgi:hypothetical protein
MGSDIFTSRILNEALTCPPATKPYWPLLAIELSIDDRAN